MGGHAHDIQSTTVTWIEDDHTDGLARALNVLTAEKRSPATANRAPMPAQQAYAPDPSHL